MKLPIILPIEEKIVKWLQKIHGELFIDVGAFLGEYCINLAENFKEVWAFEPAPDSRAKLKSNVLKFGCRNVKIFSEALSDKVGESMLYRKGGHHGGMTGIKKQYMRHAKLEILGEELGTVKVTTLENVIGSREVDLIKVDTEGSELEIWRGAKKVLPQIKRWCVEVHSTKQLDKFINLLRSEGYTNVHNFGYGRIYAERNLQ